MKIAILSDIHGNLDALKAVLEDIKAKEIDRIVVLGDLAFCGPYPKETLDFIRENLADHTLIQGNTDEMLVKATFEADDSYSPKNEIMANALKYAQDALSDNDIEFLANLPAQHSEEIEGLKLLYVHGSPRKNDEGITPKIKYSDLEEIFEGVEAHITFCGHTHFPIIHQIGKKTVVNVGSVGRPFGENPRSVYVLLDLTEVKQRKFDIEHRYVKYDNMKVAEDLEKCDFEGSDILAEMQRRATDKFPDPAELN